VENTENKPNTSFFEEIFYWMSFYWIKLISKMKSPHSPIETSCMFATLFKFLNLIFIYAIVSYIYGRSIIPFESIGKTLIVIGIIVIAIILKKMDEAFYLKKHDKIFNKYESMPPEKRIHGKIRYWLYIIITLLASATLPKLTAQYI